MVAPKTKSKEYFAESQMGVKASPRVSNKRSRLPRGGGREHVGKPYKVAGQWFRPKVDENYRNTGRASWYGDAFHGRLTANGEIYDMTHLTAAHPTMPLPSYARVTNTANGSSLIVRVNDRGPFARGRIIDLSKRAAELLDYKHAGTAQVKVEYVGPAPLHGQDDHYLMASYRPGAGQGPSPSDGLPSGVMIAMAGPTPSVAVGQPSAASFPGMLSDSGQRPVAPVAVQAAQPVPQAMPPVPAIAAMPAGDPDLPSTGPLVPERPLPELLIASASELKPRLLSYADERVTRASAVVDAFATGSLTPDAIRAAFGPREAAAPAAPYVAVGTFADGAEAERFAALLGSAGRVSVTRDDAASVTLEADGRAGLDALLRLAWSVGATDAFIVRD